MMSLSIIGFEKLSGQGFYAPGHCDLDLLPTDTKIGVIYGPWPSIIPRNVYLQI